MVEVAAEKNSTLVLPFPVEMLRYFEAAARTDAPPPVAAAETGGSQLSAGVPEPKSEPVLRTNGHGSAPAEPRRTEGS
jgi:hypothetical protein